ncbi:hypothetical protein CLV58_11029 [Spirosoma oryzae]|uniref:Uncharacterized protein n=1 Tax=Spirosoma oryzae TaxID=1469603 RepID=A0A2T0SVZ2_9BACT|nr:hypothetical protein CLV58_11029 [Spirosoma oryzae]
MRRQVSQYDKIFKENIEAVIPSLMQNILGITAIESEELPDDIQHTKERKPDVLKKLTDDKGKTYVLQMSFRLLTNLRWSIAWQNITLCLNAGMLYPLNSTSST